jgi:hypothetical protein
MARGAPHVCFVAVVAWSLFAEAAMADTYRIELALEHLPPGIVRAEMSLTYGPRSLYPWTWIAAVVRGTDVMGGRQISNRIQKTEIPIVEGRIVVDVPQTHRDSAGTWQLEDVDLRYGPHHIQLQIKDLRTHFTSERPRWTVDRKTLVYEGPGYLLGRERQALPRHFVGLRATIDHRPFSFVALPWRNDEAVLERYDWTLAGDGFRHETGAELSFYAEAGILGLKAGRTVKLPLLASIAGAQALVVDEPSLAAFLLKHHPASAERGTQGTHEDSTGVLSRIRFDELFVSPEEWAALGANARREGIEVASAEVEPGAQELAILTLQPNHLSSGHYIVVGSPAFPYFGIVVLRINEVER